MCADPGQVLASVTGLRGRGPVRMDQTRRDRHGGSCESSVLSPLDVNEGTCLGPLQASCDCQSEVVETGVTQRTRRTAMEKEKQP